MEPTATVEPRPGRREGREEPLDLPASSYLDLALSPDSGRVAFVRTDASSDVWVYELATPGATPIRHSGNGS